ncbi:hypothetical protein MRB53_018055 [Persea americana]|uniref:Uncharacterized protein n=1 Tax=Persea americana TaxID=3435 RepID=A0ACC2M7P1_PERAE|nr:hypothetical protein MRB53_018055 [Persea americana]
MTKRRHESDGDTLQEIFEETAKERREQRAEIRGIFEKIRDFSLEILGFMKRKDRSFFFASGGSARSFEDFCEFSPELALESLKEVRWMLYKDQLSVLPSAQNMVACALFL